MSRFESGKLRFEAGDLWAHGRLRLAALLSAGLLLGGCYSAEAIFEERFETGDSAEVQVQTFNGSIEIEASERDDVDVRVISQGTGSSRDDASKNLRSVVVSVKFEDGVVKVVAKPENEKVVGEPGADIRVKVPVKTGLRLEAENGQIISQGTRGKIKVRNHNGPVSLKGEFREIDVKSSDGALELESSTPALVQAKTTKGEINFRGPLRDGSKNELSTEAAPIRVSLPPDSALLLDASTSKEWVRIDFDVFFDGPFDPSKVKAVIKDDSAGTELKLRTSAAKIEVAKLKDEKEKSK